MHVAEHVHRPELAEGYCFPTLRVAAPASPGLRYFSTSEYPARPLPPVVEERTDGFTEIGTLEHSLDFGALVRLWKLPLSCYYSNVLNA